MLEKEFQFYLNHQNELVKKYKGKFIVIIGEDVIGAYDKQDDAFFETVKTHEPGSFLIQLCEAGTEAYTEIFHSRVAFA